MINEQADLSTNDEPKKRRQAEADFNALLETCLDEGWSEAECPKGCIVEPDGVCPHDFKSVALELGFI